ncbi:MAG: diacylglycerol kinase family protein [bacterium]
MYYYIYDAALADKKYSKIVARIENRLTDLGINGKIHRLSFLKNIQQILIEEFRRGIKTVVVVGTDRTLGQIINLLPDFENITIGFIPVESTHIASCLNIPIEEKACDTLSQRIVRQINLAKINDAYFLSALEINGGKFSLECDNNYFLTLEEKNNRVLIENINRISYEQDILSDNLFDVHITTTKKHLFKSEISSSTLKNAQIKVTATEPLNIILHDEKKIIKTPAKIEITPQTIKMIIGKTANYTK